jgi:dTMP kinase
LTEGLFIVLEGVEGAGKSTQARLLGEWLQDLGVRYTMAREPGGTPVGEAIREVVLDKGELTMPAETELFLILAARAAFSRDVVRPALDAGHLVVADRYDLSTFAYQGYGRGLDLDTISRANDVATGGLEPHLYLVLDLPVDTGLERKRGGGKSDRIEREGASFLSRVRAGYEAMAGARSNATLIPAQGTPEEVQYSIRKALAERFPETFSAGKV